MTSKDAIENIKKTMIIRRHGNIDVGNIYNKEILTIEKDLEVLEILRKHLIIETMDIETSSWEQVNCYLTKGKIKSLENKEDFEKIKEWLEDDK